MSSFPFPVPRVCCAALALVARNASGVRHSIIFASFGIFGVVSRYIFRHSSDQMKQRCYFAFTVTEMEAWAVLQHEAALTKIDLPLPSLTDSEVLIEVTHSGICHSDLHIWEGYNLGGGKKLLMSDRGVKLPHAMVHEVLGSVAKLVPNAKDLRIGERRIVCPWLSCGHCLVCMEGDENLCDKPQSIGIFHHGGMASHVRVRDPKYLVDPGNLAPAVACTFACSGTTVMSAVRKLSPLDLDRRLLVMGAGGLGIAAVSILKALGTAKSSAQILTRES